MTLFAAQAIFFTLVTIAVCVWCHALVRVMKVDADDEEPEPDSNSIFPNASANSEVGSRLIQGDPETVSRAIARVILSHGTAYSITERTSERVVAKRAAPVPQQSPTGNCTEMAFVIRPVSDENVDVAYCFAAGNAKRFRKIALGILFGLGLPAILIIGGVVWLYCVRSENPVLRWQVFQLLQMSHFLWPPFLMIFLHNTMKKQAKAFAANMLMQVELSDGVAAVAV